MKKIRLILIISILQKITINSKKFSEIENHNKKILENSLQNSSKFKKSSKKIIKKFINSENFDLEKLNKKNLEIFQKKYEGRKDVIILKPKNQYFRSFVSGRIKPIYDLEKFYSDEKKKILEEKKKKIDERENYVKEIGDEERKFFFDNEKKKILDEKKNYEKIGNGNGIKKKKFLDFPQIKKIKKNNFLNYEKPGFILEGNKFLGNEEKKNLLNFMNFQTEKFHSKKYPKNYKVDFKKISEKEFYKENDNDEKIKLIDKLNLLEIEKTNKLIEKNIEDSKKKNYEENFGDENFEDENFEDENFEGKKFENEKFEGEIFDKENENMYNQGESILSEKYKNLNFEEKNFENENKNMDNQNKFILNENFKGANFENENMENQNLENEKNLLKKEIEYQKELFLKRKNLIEQIKYDKKNTLIKKKKKKI